METNVKKIVDTQIEIVNDGLRDAFERDALVKVLEACREQRPRGMGKLQDHHEQRYDILKRDHPDWELVKVVTHPKSMLEFEVELYFHDPSDDTIGVVKLGVRGGLHSEKWWNTDGDVIASHQWEIGRRAAAVA